jgi:hypothetical protein
MAAAAGEARQGTAAAAAAAAAAVTDTLNCECEKQHCLAWPGQLGASCSKSRAILNMYSLAHLTAVPIVYTAHLPKQEALD